jgi:hypothetical protein
MIKSTGRAKIFVGNKEIPIESFTFTGAITYNASASTVESALDAIEDTGATSEPISGYGKVPTVIDSTAIVFDDEVE